MTIGEIVNKNEIWGNYYDYLPKYVFKQTLNTGGRSSLKKTAWDMDISVL